MRVAYFDCFSGVSGDMILGGLIDAGLKIEELDEELKKLRISGYKIRAEKTSRCGLCGMRFLVDVTGKERARRLKDLLKIIEESDLDDDIKGQGLMIFKRLAGVEARLHDKDINLLHLHEIGGLDSIIDIIGSLIGIKRLGIAAVYSSKLNLGSGFVKTQHGILPVPSPAALELLKGVPIYSTGMEGELTTPTGAAILTSLSREFGRMPEMKVTSIGYGAGSMELEIPNLLRVYIGEVEDKVYGEDRLLLIQTNIDDMNPEFYDHTFERLKDRGAVDVFIIPISMKKNRVGSLLNVLIPQEKLEETLSVIFRETTTFGVRIQHFQRRCLLRETISVRTNLGDVRVKIGKIKGEVVNITPEYEDCRNLALKKGVPLKRVYDEAKMEAQGILNRDCDSDSRL